MDRLTKALVLVSLFAAIGLEAWLASSEWGRLAGTVAVACLFAVLAARLAPRLTAQVVCGLAYLTPVLFTAILGRFRLPYLLVWLAAVAGLQVGTPGWTTWAYPRRWRFALITWALVVAVVWPIIVVREYDFLPFVLDRYRLGNSGSGGPPRTLALWVADVAIVHLIGLLWLDWLLRRFRSERLAGFRTGVAAPLAVSVLLASALGVYQGLFDLHFLSGGRWPLLQRATGSMVDANVFGLLAALWTGGALALLPEDRRGVARWAAPGLCVLCWAGLWMSGSRTAFAAALIVLVAVVWGSAQAALRARRSLVPVAAGVLVAALVVVGLATLPSRTQTPLQRVRATIPHLSLAGARAAAREMWRRNLYGTASTRMVAEFPLFGVGLGAVHLLVTDYSTAVTGIRIPPDNAQNWFRHQLAELGIIGSVGWILSCGLLLHLLVTTRGEGHARLPASALKGALIGFGVVSMVGVPGQSAPVALTFWTFVFWYASLVSPDQLTSPPATAPALRPAAWTLMILLVTTHAIGTVYQARHDLRVPNRAARFGWPYSYGGYAEERGDRGMFRWTRDRAVFVVPGGGPWLELTAWIGHPDARQHPVRLRVWVAGALVIDEDRPDTTRLTRYVPIAAQRIVVEAAVSRTWRPAAYGRSSDERDLGAALSWTVVDSPYPAAGGRSEVRGARFEVRGAR